MADLAALQQLLQQQAVAQGQSNGLEQQRANAMALRDSPAQQAGSRSGYASPLGNIAQVLNSYSGNKLQAQVEPQIAAGQQAIAAGQAAQQGYALQKAVEKEELAAEQYGIEQGRKSALVKVAADREAKRQEELAASLGVEAANRLEDTQMKEDEAVREDRFNPETGEVESILRYTQSGELERDGELIENPSAWEEVKSTKTGGGNPYAWSSTRRAKAEEDATQAKRMLAVLDDFKPEYGSPDSRVPLAGSASNYISGKTTLTTDQMKERAAWWKRYRSVHELMQRHEMFGSTVSGGETGLWKASAPNEDMEGSAILEVHKRLREEVANDAKSKQYSAGRAGLDAGYRNSIWGGLYTPDEEKAPQETPTEFTLDSDEAAMDAEIARLMELNQQATAP